ncbi:MAG TPA: hypothetical protein VJL89_06520 [Thermodesulfovibrionia bacterium]|nr:hypothetical protein [Thermodesulfovibrionia bacterium]
MIITTSFYASNDYDQQWKRDVQKDFVSSILSISGIEDIEKYHFQYVNDYTSESVLKSYIEECYDIARNI